MECKKNKVIHVGFKHSKEDTRIFWKECSSLANSGKYDVSYITSDINSPDGTDTKNGVKRIIIHAAPKRIVRQLEYNRELKRVIQDDKDIALVHLHEAPLLLIALWIKRKGIHVIYDSHEDYYQQIRMSHNLLLAKLYKAYEKHVCKRIDGVIFPCKMLDQQVFDYPVKRLVYIDNYPIVDDLHDKKPVSEFRACYTGTLSWDRGVGNAVQAWEKAGVKGIIAGKFSSAQEKERIEALSGYKQVDYWGVLPADEVQTVYENASVGMAILRDAGQYHKSCNIPTKVGEYMMAGLATVIYSNPYVESLLKQYKFGIAVDPDNIQEVADTLRYLKSNPQEVETMGREGQKAVKEMFNWKAQEIKLLGLYEDILGANER